MSNLEIFLAVTGLIYVILASLNKSSCWIFGILSCAVLAYVSYTDYKLYADAWLNLFYVVIGFMGLSSWLRGNKNESDGTIGRAPKHLLVYSLTGGAILSIVCGYLLQYLDGAFATYWDSATTVFSVIATWFLVKRYIENWYMWIVIDLVMVWLYFLRGGNITAGLFLIYALVAIYGAYQWRRQLSPAVSS